MQQLILILLILLFGFVSCSKDNSLAPLVQQVEALMPHRPDSALILLERIKNVEKFSKRNKACYYLLLTEAQDKNYVNHTTDTLITISAEYYEDINDLKCKAKAWYYKGIIN